MFVNCDTTDNFMKITGTYFDKIVKQIDCQALFDSHLIESNDDISDKQHDGKPPSMPMTPRRDFLSTSLSRCF